MTALLELLTMPLDEIPSKEAAAVVDEVIIDKDKNARPTVETVDVARFGSSL